MQTNHHAHRQASSRYGHADGDDIAGQKASGYPPDMTESYVTVAELCSARGGGPHCAVVVVSPETPPAKGTVIDNRLPEEIAYDNGHIKTRLPDATGQRALYAAEQCCAATPATQRDFVMERTTWNSRPPAQGP